MLSTADQGGGAEEKVTDMDISVDDKSVTDLSLFYVDSKPRNVIITKKR